MSQDICFASFNLYNLQLPGKPWRRNSDPYTEKQYQAKVEWSASVIKRLDADVIAFQELWSKKCLEDIFQVANLQHNYQLIFIKDDWYDIAVAAAVRDPWEVQKKTIHKLFPEEFVLIKRGGGRDRDEDREDDDIEVNIDRFSRSILQMSIGHKDHTELPLIETFAIHLKSKLATRLDKEERDNEAVRPHSTALGSALSTIRRTAEAAALRIILTNQMKSTTTPVTVLGDFNDGTLSNTLSVITQQPSYRMYASSRSGSASDVGLYSASLLQDLRSFRDVNYTHEFKGVREILDHVLVSEQFYDYSRNRVWTFKELRVWNDHLEDDDKSTSDHGVVSAQFLFDPA